MERLQDLEKYEVDSFEAWLDQRLRMQYSASAKDRYRAFDLRNLNIPFGESHVDAILALFEQLSAAAQARFRRAIEQLLRHAQAGDFPGEAMSDLVLVVGLTKAFGAMLAFAPVIGTGPWGEIRKSLIYDALAVLLMFDRTEEAYATAKALATSINFNDAFIFDAYLVMARAKPEHWSSDLNLVGGRFARLIQSVQESGVQADIDTLRNKQREFAVSLAAAVPLLLLASQLENLDMQEYEWLVKLLFHPSSTMWIQYDKNDGCLEIAAAAGSRIPIAHPQAEAFIIQHKLTRRATPRNPNTIRIGTKNALEETRSVLAGF